MLASDKLLDAFPVVFIADVRRTSDTLGVRGLFFYYVQWVHVGPNSLKIVKPYLLLVPELDRLLPVLSTRRPIKINS